MNIYQIIIENIDELRASVKSCNIKLWCRMTAFRHALVDERLEPIDALQVFRKFEQAVTRHFAQPSSLLSS